MSVVPTVELKNGLRICRILNGMWQVSGGHGNIDPKKAVAEMSKYVQSGLTTFDMADIYGPSEDIYGAFLTQYQKETGSSANVQGLTKWVPRPGDMTKSIVEQNINRSMQRMGVKKLDCLQFHWWQYSDPRYIEALRHMADMQKQGKIGELSLTNFDTIRLQKIVEEEGINISTNQVQYSLIDMRPAQKMAPFCVKHGIKLLTYGTLGGGLISEKYLGAPEPKGRAQLNTASLGKYKNMIDQWGGWPLFQELLTTLNTIAKSHNASISNVATRFILDQPAVGGVIIGCRLGVSQHIEDNLRVFAFELAEEEKARIEGVLAKANDLMKVIGDCGDEYR